MKWLNKLWESSFVKKWRDKILDSTKDHLGKESATRINGYLMSAMITLMVVVTCAVEIGNMYIAFKELTPYEIGYGFIAIFGMVLSHQLVLFNLKKSSEQSSFPTVEALKKGNTETEKSEE